MGYLPESRVDAIIRVHAERDTKKTQPAARCSLTNVAQGRSQMAGKITGAVGSPVNPLALE
jgi:hypothetical protein